MTTSPDRIVWLDVETTGLYPARHKIVELAMVVTDYSFEELASFDIVVGTTATDWHEVESVVLEMHGASGLRKKSLNAQGYEYWAEKESIKFLEEWCSESKPVMAGRNVSFDRDFLRNFMPSLVELFHYRIIDVCTLQHLCRISWRSMPKFKNAHKHRALADAREAIQETKHYLQHLEVKQC